MSSYPRIEQLQMIQELESMAALAAGKSPSVLEAPPVEFGSVLQSAVEQVNASQQAAKNAQQRFEQGDPAVSLLDTVMKSQKASLAFQVMMRLSKDCIGSYREIMNTQV